MSFTIKFWNDLWSGAEEKTFETLVGANLTYADLSNMDLEGVDLTGAILRSAKAEKTNFKNAILKDVWAEGLQANNSDFTGADLSNSTFAGGEFIKAILKDNKLNNTRFAHCQGIPSNNYDKNGIAYYRTGFGKLY